MREISLKAKRQVITLFFSGLSYDQLSRESGVSKGGVVNIIDDYRDGRLVVTGDMTECVDELRRVSADLKKYHTTVSQVISYTKIHNKIQEMGVDSESLEQWIDICRDIALPDSADKQFVVAALELARMESQAGLTYQEILGDYKAKLAMSTDLDGELDKKEEQLSKAKLKHEREQEQAEKQLNSIK